MLEPKLSQMPIGEMGKICVRNLNTLRIPGGTGCVDDIGEIIGLNRVEGRELTRKEAPRLVEYIDLAYSTAEPVEQGLLGDHCLCA
jgi:hypothetical protein